MLTTPSQAHFASQSIGQQIVLKSPASFGDPELGPRGQWKDGVHTTWSWLLFAEDDLPTSNPEGWALRTGGSGEAGVGFAFFLWAVL